MHIKHSLAKHAFQEENVVYPSLRDHGAAEAADHLNSEHGYVKQYLFDLHMMPKDDPAWMTKIREFRSMLEKHMAEERSEEHTSELQSLMRISYADICLQKKKMPTSHSIINQHK